jgi:hypothetical protein
VKYTDQGADLSSCGTYRYRLWRAWDRSLTRRATFIMLNPSTASESEDDPTVRKVVGFAQRWGCGRIDIVNLFAFRATAPDDLVRFVRRFGLPRAVGEDTDTHVSVAVRDALDAGVVVVAAWGSNANRRELRRRVDIVRVLLWHLSSPYPERDVMCLGRASDGCPRHPLMLAYSTPLVTL